MHVTVVICTWNRAQFLNRTLIKMTCLRIPPEVDWEVIVVNNNCTDDTDAVIEAHKHNLPIRRVFQPMQGLSNARNAGVRAACGELLLWTDDDVLVDAGWVEAYLGAAHRWPEASFFGGPIVPWYEYPPPTWVASNLRLLQGLLVIRDLGSEEFVIGSKLPFGANMAFRRQVLNDNSFDPLLGVKGMERFSSEETVLMQRLQKLGAKGVWVPEAKVAHYVPVSRMTLSFAWQYEHGAGRSDVRRGEISKGKKVYSGVPRWLYRRYWQLLWKYYTLRLFACPTWPEAFLRAARVSGMIKEFRSSL